MGPNDFVRGGDHEKKGGQALDSCPPISLIQWILPTRWIHDPEKRNAAQNFQVACVRRVVKLSPAGGVGPAASKLSVISTSWFGSAP